MHTLSSTSGSKCESHVAVAVQLPSLTEGFKERNILRHIGVPFSGPHYYVCFFFSCRMQHGRQLVTVTHIQQ